jgi:hypothetical protein
MHVVQLPAPHIAPYIHSRTLTCTSHDRPLNATACYCRSLPNDSQGSQQTGSVYPFGLQWPTQKGVRQGWPKEPHQSTHEAVSSWHCSGETRTTPLHRSIEAIQASSHWSHPHILISCKRCVATAPNTPPSTATDWRLTLLYT